MAYSTETEHSTVSFRGVIENQTIGKQMNFRVLLMKGVPHLLHNNFEHSVRLWYFTDRVVSIANACGH